MLPVLELLSGAEDVRTKDLTKLVADRFQLTNDERQEMLASGQQTIIANRVGWAKTYLKKAGLVSNPRRGVVRITSEGVALLRQGPARIDTEFLRTYPAFLEFVDADETTPSGTEAAPEKTTPETITPEESLEAAYRTLRHALADEVLDRVRTCSPQFFERLVVDLLVAMGYGGSFADAGQAIGRSGDGGIDGIIKEDKLGLDVVCIQAKRWQKTVGRPEVQAFAGSMDGFRARKGVMIATAPFSRDAHDFVSRIDRRIVLIDGQRLAHLMIDHDIGVATSRTYAIKRVEDEYFNDEDV
jgi:restriction system protein